MTENEDRTAGAEAAARATREQRATGAATQAPTPNPEPVEGPRDPEYTGEDSPNVTGDRHEQEESQ
jgi:hypothetical protein